MDKICPYCGEDMERGFVMAHFRSNIYWLPETAENIPFLMDEEGIEKQRHGFILSDGAHILKREHPWKTLVTAKEMYVCRKCGKGVVDLE